MILKTPIISIYHDTRYQKQGGKFPVKIRVYDPRTRKQRFFSTPLDLTIEAFNEAWPKRPSNRRFEAKILHDEILAILTHAEQTLKSYLKGITVFSFEEFERKLYSDYEAEATIKFWLDDRRDYFKHNQKVSSYQAYHQCETFLRGYLGNDYDNFPLDGFTKHHVLGFKDYLRREGKSESTTHKHLSTLRSVFNHARNMEAPVTIEPFRGVDMGSIKARSDNHLSLDQFKRFRDADLSDPRDRIARDIWLFSFYCNGAYLSDILRLKIRDFEGDSFTFKRYKTRHVKSQKTVRVHVTQELREIAVKCSPLLGSLEGLNDADAHEKTNRTNARTNVGLKRIAKALDLPDGFSMRWARHTYGTLKRDAGVDAHLIANDLGHHTSATTEKNYFGALAPDVVEKQAEKLRKYLNK